MTPLRSLLTLVILSLCLAANADAQCVLTNDLVCPPTLTVGGTGVCTLRSHNSGPGACIGFGYSYLYPYDDDGTERIARFTTASSSLFSTCLTAIPEFPEFDFPFAYCFSENITVQPGQTFTMSGTLTLLQEPPSGILNVVAVSLFVSEESDETIESDPAFATIVAGAAGCRTPRAPVVNAPGRVFSGQDFEVSVTPVPGASNYDLEESTSPTFDANLVIRRVTLASGRLPSSTFRHDVTAPTPYYYRARAIADCNQSIGPYSEDGRSVVEPPPAPNSTQFELTTSIGSQQPIVFQMFIPSPEAAAKRGLDTGYTAGGDKSWLTVQPPSGTIPPNGTTLTVTANPTGLQPGGQTGTVNVTNSTTGQPIANVPVGVNLVGPISTVGKGPPPANTLIVPVVAHLSGLQSQFQSDIRMSNLSTTPINYRLAFTPSGADGTQVGAQTAFSIETGQTLALNDLLKTTFGLGTLSGERSGGSLEIRPLAEINLPGQPPSTAPTLVASTRTYAITASGTRGQFIPAVPFSEFAGVDSTLSLQHLAESEEFRTNVGFVEGSGEAATIVLRAFNSAGQELASRQIDLRPFEHHQFNRLFREMNVSGADLRLEVAVTSPTGRITAYASVLHNRTDDPYLVRPVNLSAATESEYVVPAVKQLSGAATMNTDLRVFNASTSPRKVRFTFYPASDPAAARTSELNFGAREVRVLNAPLSTLFNLPTGEGSLLVSGEGAAPIVVTSRVYSVTGADTFGEFVEPFTRTQGVAAGERSLQILQLEQSALYNGRVGLFELSGSAVTVQLEAFVPDSKLAIMTTVELRANEFRELNLRDVLGAAGNAAVYNARVSLRVTGGAGRVGAYGSLIDAKTLDPTYVPAQ
jgi:hypothetical protein